MSLTRLHSFLMALSLVAAFGLVSVAAAKPGDDVDWTPQLWGQEDTLQFRTDCPDEGEHWSYVWLVLIDNEVYVRLGSRAAARIDCNKTKPIVAVRISDKLEFPEVEMVPVPEKADEVAQAMAAKYWTVVFIRYMDHPYTMKLVPKEDGEVLGRRERAGEDGDSGGGGTDDGKPAGDAKTGSDAKNAGDANAADDAKASGDAKTASGDAKASDGAKSDGKGGGAR